MFSEPSLLRPREERKALIELEVIKAATRVPVELVRKRLREIAARDDEEEAQAALAALISLRSPAAVTPLIRRDIQARVG